LLELAELLEDEPFLDRGEDGLHGGGGDEAGLPPFGDRELPEGGVGAELAGRGRRRRSYSRS
jgi:hypothetical protein